MRVRILDAQTRKPVAGAIVSVVALPREVEFRRLVHSPQRPDLIDRLVAEGGRHFQADGGGEALVPGLERALLVGRNEGAWGRFVFSSDEPFRLPEGMPATILVHPDLELRVQVVDPEGRPVAGVPVGLDDVGHRLRTVVLATTVGEEGLAVFPHLAANLGSSSARRLAVRLALPAPGLEAFPVEFPALPPDPPRLVLPPTGRVIVRVVEPGGSPFREDGVVQLEGMLRPQPGSGLPSTSFDSPGGEAISVGRAEFPFVGLGLDLEASLIPLPGQAFLIGNARGRGPSFQGETVELELRLQPREPRFVGRLVGPTGQAARKTRIDVLWSAPQVPSRAPVTPDAGGPASRPPERATSPTTAPRPHRVAHVETDAEGRFRFPWPFSRDPSPAGNLTFRTGAEVEPAQEGRVELPAMGSSADTDLGDIALDVPPFVVSGRVVTSQGRPVEGVEVSVHGSPSRTSDIVHTYIDESGKVDAASDSTPPGEERHPRSSTRTHLSARTGPDGAFTIHGALAEGSYSLEARSSGGERDLKSELVPFRLGARDVEIVALRGGIVEGSLILPDEASPRRGLPGIGVSILHPGQTGNGWYPGWVDDERWCLVIGGEPLGNAELRSDGTFRRGDLQPGRVRVEVRIFGRREPLLAVDDVVVELDRVTRDPRIQRIDLRGRLHRMEIEVLDVSGKAVQHATVERADQRQVHAFDEIGTCAFVREGRAIVLSELPSLHLRIRADGLRTVEIPEASGRMRVVMLPAIPVRIRAPKGWEPPHAGVRLGVVISRESPRWQGRGTLQVAPRGEQADEVRRLFPAETAKELLTERRELDFAVPEPGSYRVWWTVSIRRQGMDVERSLSPQGGSAVVVSDSGELQVLEPEFPWSEYERVLANPDAAPGSGPFIYQRF